MLCRVRVILVKGGGAVKGMLDQVHGRLGMGEGGGCRFGNMTEEKWRL